MAMPTPVHSVLDQTQLMPAGSVGAFRHTLSVPLPAVHHGPHLTSLGEPGDRDTWTELTAALGETVMLSVVLLTGDDALTDDQAAVMTGELAEAWLTVLLAADGQ